MRSLARRVLAGVAVVATGAVLAPVALGAAPGLPGWVQRMIDEAPLAAQRVMREPQMQRMMNAPGMQHMTTTPGTQRMMGSPGMQRMMGSPAMPSMGE